MCIKKKADNLITIKCPTCPKEWMLCKSLFSEGLYTVNCSGCGGIFDVKIALNINIKRR